jgi:hypothetical protein
LSELSDLQQSLEQMRMRLGEASSPEEIVMLQTHMKKLKRKIQSMEA